MTAAPRDLEAAVARLDWPAAEGPDDWPWLDAVDQQRPGAGLVRLAARRGGHGGLAAAIRAALPAALRRLLGAVIT